jgi:hypothetical protein
VNIIGLTGRNMRAMADVAEQLLVHISDNGLSVAVMLYVDEIQQVRAMRTNAHGLTEIWRIGLDPTRPEFDHVLDAFIDDKRGAQALAEQTTRQVRRFATYLDLLHRSRAVSAAPFLL